MTHGPRLNALRRYITETRPELARELGPLPLSQAVELLCRRTGLEPRPGDENIEDGALDILQALSAIDASAEETAAAEKQAAAARSSPD